MASLDASFVLPGIAVFFLSETTVGNRASGWTETLTLHMEGVTILYDGPKSTFDLSVYHVQVDDMRYRVRFPVVLAPCDSGLNSHLRKVGLSLYLCIYVRLCVLLFFPIADIYVYVSAATRSPTNIS